ncbi:MAG: hypothetical protein ABI577_11820 [bacterium]
MTDFLRTDIFVSNSLFEAEFARQFRQQPIRFPMFGFDPKVHSVRLPVSTIEEIGLTGATDRGRYHGGIGLLRVRIGDRDALCACDGPAASDVPIVGRIVLHQLFLEVDETGTLHFEPVVYRI